MNFRRRLVNYLGLNGSIFPTRTRVLNPGWCTLIKIDVMALTVFVSIKVLCCETGRRGVENVDCSPSTLQSSNEHEDGTG